jgi:hypothetical protein
MHQDAIIVRAPDENAARKHATARFLASPPKHGPMKSLHSPWRDKSLVRCTLLKNPVFEKEGPVAVLDPPEWAD